MVYDEHLELQEMFSDRGRLLLVYKNHRYRERSKHTWRCTVKDCKATFRTTLVNGKRILLALGSEHCHEPLNDESLEWKRISSYVVKIATLHPTKGFDEVVGMALGGSCENLSARNLVLLKRKVYNARKVPESQVSNSEESYVYGESEPWVFQATFSAEADGPIRQFGYYGCRVCGKTYKTRTGWRTHSRYECGKDPQFQCPVCPHRTKRKGSLKTHLFMVHRNIFMGVERRNGAPVPAFVDDDSKSSGENKKINTPPPS